MPKFRKKPVVIEAVQFLPENVDELYVLSEPNEARTVLTIYRDFVRQQPYKAEIQTLEGTMQADIGDWIIKGVKGELYPCKPDIFAATYDPA